MLTTHMHAAPRTMPRVATRLVGIADPQDLFARGLEAVFDEAPNVNAVAAGRTQEAMVEFCQKNAPDLVVVDIELLGHGDDPVLASLLDTTNQVLVVCRRLGTDGTRRLLNRGVAGVILRDARVDEFANAVQRVLDDERYVDPTIGAQLAHEIRFGTALTERELEVAELIALGYSSSGASARLFVSPRTVESHRARFMAKLGITSRTALVRWALDNRIIGPS